MRHLQKDYSYAFVLEPTKLTRLMDVIHDRLESDDAGPIDKFELFLKGNLVEELDSLDEVLNHENFRKKRIDRLSITSSGPLPDGSGSDTVIVDFGIKKSPHNSAPNTTPSEQIAVSVTSPSAEWASRTLSAVEEQVERTRVRYGAALVAMLFVLGFMLALLMFQLRSIKVREDYSSTLWLDDAAIQRVNQILSQGRPITDEELREITTMQMRNLVREQLPSPTAPDRSRKMVVLLLPILCVVGCSVILLFTCYPKKTFFWGDGVEHYNTLLQRRRIIWGIIIGVTVIGIFSKLLYEAIASLIPG